jgi:hypothetical protein
MEFLHFHLSEQVDFTVREGKETVENLPLREAAAELGDEQTPGTTTLLEREAKSGPRAAPGSPAR